MKQKFVFLCLSLCLISWAQAFSFGVPKDLIESAVAKKFPMEKYTITLDHPVLKFKKVIGKIEICGLWSEKITRATGEFCLDAQPLWNKGKGDIEIAKLNILKISAKDYGELPANISRTLNASVLSLLDGTSIYHVPDLVGQHLENIQIEESSLRLLF